MKRSVFAVIVLYKTRISDCVSLRTLLAAAHHLDAKSFQLHVLVHDNTPDANFDETLPNGVLYVGDENNSGLATAYNQALRMAADQGAAWLLTLDQDTVISHDGLALLLAATVEVTPDVAAIVPQIRSGSRIVSPHYFQAGGWPRWFAPGYEGIPFQATYALNSGSLLRVAALQQAGGYSPQFWLDQSDYNLYRQLHKLGKRVCVVGKVELDHDLSMTEMQQKVSPSRYRTMLLAESAFWDLEMNALAGLERTLRLAVRALKHLLRRDSLALQRLTLGGLALRLFHTRRYRIQRWRAATAPLIAACPSAAPVRSQPKVSICMAAYNGQKYLIEQIESIVPQLQAQDEMVIVDDASSDATLELLMQFRDELAAIPGAPAVVLLTHQQNMGVVRTFEDALRAATGDVLFLSDDDDRWAPEKVARVRAALAADPDLQLVSTGLALMDEAGYPVAEKEFMRHRRFTASALSNLLHNQFQGSTLAFRSSLLAHLLPFPVNRLYLHDAWIGLRAILSGCKILHIDEPLLYYRRHGANFSRRLSRWRQIKLRLQLGWDLLFRSLSRF